MVIALSFLHFLRVDARLKDGRSGVFSSDPSHLHRMVFHNGDAQYYYKGA